MSNKLNAFIVSLAVSLIFALGFFGGYTFNDITENKPVVNVNVPKSQINTSVNNMFAPNISPQVSNDIQVKGSRRNYIQANYHENLQISVNNGAAIIQGVDTTGKIRGFSMRPTMFTGHTMLLKEYNREMELEEGMIVRFEHTEDDYWIHRIEGNYLYDGGEKGYLFTRGDNRGSGEKVYPENITHTVVGTVYTGDETNE